MSSTKIASPTASASTSTSKSHQTFAAMAEFPPFHTWSQSTLLHDAPLDDRQEITRLRITNSARYKDARKNFMLEYPGATETYLDRMLGYIILKSDLAMQNGGQKQEQEKNATREKHIPSLPVKSQDEKLRQQERKTEDMFKYAAQNTVNVPYDHKECKQTIEKKEGPITEAKSKRKKQKRQDDETGEPSRLPSPVPTVGYPLVWDLHPEVSRRDEFEAVFIAALQLRIKEIHQ